MLNSLHISILRHLEIFSLAPGRFALLKNWKDIFAKVLPEANFNVLQVFVVGIKGQNVQKFQPQSQLYHFFKTHFSRTCFISCKLFNFYLVSRKLKTSAPYESTLSSEEKLNVLPTLHLRKGARPTMRDFAVTALPSTMKAEYVDVGEGNKNLLLMSSFVIDRQKAAILLDVSGGMATKRRSLTL